MVTLTLFPGFARTANPPGETVSLGSKRVYWSGIGNVSLEYLNADDRLTLSGPNGVFDNWFSPGCGPLQPAGPFDITNIFAPGTNDIYATVYDLCGGDIGVWDINITGDISFTAPANIISATLTVDKNDCVAPCTVNGTVSWTNNGGTSGTLDPAILVNTIPTSLGSAVAINPGETSSYIFQLPGLLAGTYTIQASPNAGTVPQTITVRTPANIVATVIVPSVTTCTEPCNLTVDITWANNGQTTGTFTPTITVNGIPTALALESLNSGQSITKVFPLTGLMAGTYSICANPNTLPCATVTVLTPANIVATAITPSVMTCTAPCDVNVDITWVNNGQTTGTFTPTIVVNGVSTQLIPENLSPGQSTTKTFPLTGLTVGTYDIVGTYNICAYPNTFPCKTVTVERAAVAGGGAGMLLGIVGIVALGMMMTSKPKT